MRTNSRMALLVWFTIELLARVALQDGVALAGLKIPHFRVRIVPSHTSMSHIEGRLTYGKIFHETIGENRHLAAEFAGNSRFSGNDVLMKRVEELQRQTKTELDKETPDLATVESLLKERKKVIDEFLKKNDKLIIVHEAKKGAKGEVIEGAWEVRVIPQGAVATPGAKPGALDHVKAGTEAKREAGVMMASEMKQAEYQESVNRLLADLSTKLPPELFARLKKRLAERQEAGYTATLTELTNIKHMIDRTLSKVRPGEKAQAEAIIDSLLDHDAAPHHWAALDAYLSDGDVRLGLVHIVNVEGRIHNKLKKMGKSRPEAERIAAEKLGEWLSANEAFHKWLEADPKNFEAWLEGKLPESVKKWMNDKDAALVCRKLRDGNCLHLPFFCAA